MYKATSRFMVKTGLGVLSSRYGESKRKPRLVEFAVVSFRVRKDNCGRERVFRYISTFFEKGMMGAEACFMKTVADFKVLVHRGEVIREEGDRVLMSTWAQTRKGVNIDADPLLASGYGRRWAQGPSRYFE